MRDQVINNVRRLRLVRSGEIYEPHRVRFILAEARELEQRIEKWHMALWNMRREAECAFCEGWPKVKRASWMID